MIPSNEEILLYNLNRNQTILQGLFCEGKKGERERNAYLWSITYELEQIRMLLTKMIEEEKIE